MIIATKNFYVQWSIFVCAKDYFNHEDQMKISSDIQIFSVLFHLFKIYNIKKMMKIINPYYHILLKISLLSKKGLVRTL